MLYIMEQVWFIEFLCRQQGIAGQWPCAHQNWIPGNRLKFNENRCKPTPWGKNSLFFLQILVVKFVEREHPPSFALDRDAPSAPNACNSTCSVYANVVPALHQETTPAMLKTTVL